MFLFTSIFVFVFKQKTADDMRMSDWGSNVCSSDLVRQGVRTPVPAVRVCAARARGGTGRRLAQLVRPGSQAARPRPRSAATGADSPAARATLMDVSVLPAGFPAIRLSAARHCALVIVVLALAACATSQPATPPRGSLTTATPQQQVAAIRAAAGDGEGEQIGRAHV